MSITALTNAIIKRDLTLLNQCIEDVEDVNCIDKYGLTPLRIAANEIWLDGMEALIDAGAISIPDNSGRTPRDIFDLSIQWTKREGEKLLKQSEKAKKEKK